MTVEVDTNRSAQHTAAVTTGARGAWGLEIVEPNAPALVPGDGPVGVLPHVLRLDGQVLPDGVEFIDVDFGRKWPLTVTLGVPSDQLRYVVTRTNGDGLAIGGRVWIGGIEVATPTDPIAYPHGDEIAYVDVIVDDFRIGRDRTLDALLD